MPPEKQSHLLQSIASYGKDLLSFIRKRVRNDADAEDILQDVWYQFSTWVNVAPIEQTGAWLYKVARNRIIDKQRKKSEELIDHPGMAQDEDDSLLNLLPIETATPETEYFKSLFWEQLVLALDELPAEQKEVFVWQELEGIPFEELAKRTGEKVQTLVSRKRYAVLHLRKRLKQLYYELNQE
jgi:RNA polymerase sigma factor (sigma-70 family)